MREKALSGILAASGRPGDTTTKELEEVIKQKSVSDIVAKITTEVPLPVSGLSIIL